MWSEVVGDTFRAWLHVSDAQGNLRTGLVAGNFVVTVRSPDNVNTTTPTVVESGTPGLYYFDVLGSFLTTNGAGEYGVVVVVSATDPTLRGTASKVLKVSTTDLSSVEANINTILVDVDMVRKINENRLEVDFGAQQLILYDDDGVTPLTRWNLATDGGEDVATSLGVQTKRGIPQ